MAYETAESCGSDIPTADGSSFPCANRAQLLHLVGVPVYGGLLSMLVREHERTS